jgi:hypothetical protein
MRRGIPSSLQAFINQQRGASQTIYARAAFRDRDKPALIRIRQGEGSHLSAHHILCRHNP